MTDPLSQSLVDKGMGEELAFEATRALSRFLHAMLVTCGGANSLNLNFLVDDHPRQGFDVEVRWHDGKSTTNLLAQRDAEIARLRRRLARHERAAVRRRYRR